MKRRNAFDVYAVSEGVILWVLPEVREADGYKSAYGLRVLVKHLDGTIGWYCHLANTHLKKGSHVKAGSIIGRMGNTGRSEQKVIPARMIEIIKHMDGSLYSWIKGFIDDNGEVYLNSFPKNNLMMNKRLEFFLDKHLHLMLTPDEKKLQGKYAICPLDWIFNGCPPVNTKQSLGGGWHAKYIDGAGNEYEHEGWDGSGDPANIIDGWENQTIQFRKIFYESIDKVA